VKAISLWQPWASYIAVGMKRFETRSWSTGYRGPLAIHAAKRRLTEYELDLLDEWPLPIRLDEIPYGAVVAVATLADCRMMASGRGPDDKEDALGDWSPGRFAWALHDVRQLAFPFPCRGAQGLFDLPAVGLLPQDDRRTK
jgi:hypothetical protein